MKSWIKWQKDHSERFTESVLNEVKNPFGYDVPSTSEIYNNYKYSGSYNTPHDAWEAARRAKYHYDEYHGEDEPIKYDPIQKKDKPCKVNSWPYEKGQIATFTIVKPPKLKDFKYNYGKAFERTGCRYRGTVLLQANRLDGKSDNGNYVKFVYYINTKDLPSEKDIPFKEGDTVTGKQSFYYGSSTYGWFIVLNGVKLASDTTTASEAEEKTESNTFKQSEPTAFVASSLFKKEMQSKKNPSETYFLYTAKDENGQKYSWFSKENFNDGDKVTGTMDSIYGNAIKLKGVKLAESKFREDTDKQKDDIEMFVRDWIDAIVKPYVYDHDVEGLAHELAYVTDNIINMYNDEVVEELGYEPDWDLFEEICDDIVEDEVMHWTYKEGFEDLNDLFCEEFE